MEDLLAHAGMTGEVTGIDVGCGASCIYCLLAVRNKFDWKMFALEIDKDNLKHAQENIARNQLEGRITIVAQDDSSSLFAKLFEVDPRQKSFCLCNPPFFSSIEEVRNSQNRTGNRKRPRSATSGSPAELVFEDGGELGFVKRMIEESAELMDKIEIYSTMLGCQKNLQLIVDELRKRKVDNYTKAVFAQGKTARWGIAWSFKHDLRTFKDHSEPTKKASKNILQHRLETSDFERTVEDLEKLFADLKIVITPIEAKAGQFHRWELTAKEVTWTNSRRKRRAEISQKIFQDSEPKEPIDLHIAFELQHRAAAAHIQMFFISGNASKDSVNQILQFIKNKL